MRPTPAEIVRAVHETLERDVVGAVNDPFVRLQVQLMIPALSGAAESCDADTDRTRHAVQHLDEFLGRAAIALAAIDPGDDTELTTLNARLVYRPAFDPTQDFDPADLQARRLEVRALLAEVLVACERARDDGRLAELRAEAYAVAAST